MTTITIYSPSGTAVPEAPITNDAKVFRQLGGDYYIELSFNVASVLALPKGSYIQIADPTTDIVSKYALKKDASPEPISGVNGYKYVLKFYAGQHDMEACQIKWLAGERAELSFRLTTSLREYAKLIADNMNAYLESDIWAYDESLDDKDMQEQSFEGISCWDAINNIANAFGVEWWVSHGEKLTIHFGKCENEGTATVIREGEIVNRFPAPKRGDDSNYGTRFYIFGGSQNVPDDYRKDNSTTGGTTFHISEKRICLRKFAENGLGPAGDYISYFDAVKVLKGEIVEKTIILDDIFPKNETTIKQGYILEQNENIIDGQDPQSVYYIKVDNKPTLLSTLGITFTSGALAGRSFNAAIITDKDSYKIKVIHTTENSGGSSLIAIPNANLRPEVGDKYILTGVKLDDSRIEYAERELWNKGTVLALQRANDTNVYDCTTNHVYCHDNGVNFDLGDKVELKGAHFGEDGRKSRIQGYEKKLYNPYIATYNIGDNSVYSRTLKAYKDASLPLMSVVATTERKNEILQAQISSSQSDVVLATTIQRITNLEGKDTDTAETVSVPGAKKYAEAKVQEVEENFKAITGKIADANSNLIGLLFYGGTNISVANTHPKNLAFFTPSVDFNIRYNDFGKTNVQVNDTWIEVSIVKKGNYQYCKGAAIYIAEDVETKNISDDLGFVLKAGDWLVATENGWKKINCGTVRTIKGNGNEIPADEYGVVDLGNVVTSIKSNGQAITMQAGGLIDLGTIGGASDAEIEDINNRIDGLETSISANTASIKDAKEYAEEQATAAYNEAKAYVDREARNIFADESSKLLYEVKEDIDEKVAGAKTYTDDEIEKALATAKGYADEKASQENIETAVSSALTAAKNYTNTREAAIKDAVTKGIPGTENFAMYAGTTYHVTRPFGGGIYVETTSQFDNVYAPTKDKVMIGLEGAKDRYAAPITASDASKYNGAVIYITGNVGAGVLSDNALIANDVVMAVGGKWVKINDTNTEVTEEYVKSLLQTEDVKASIFQNLTGVTYSNQLVKIKMPVIKATPTSTSQITLFKPNTIYELRQMGTSASPYTLPWLSTSNWKEGDKWVIKGYACYLNLSNWKNNVNANPARDVRWDTLPNTNNPVTFNITVHRMKSISESGTYSIDLYLVSCQIYGTKVS